SGVGCVSRFRYNASLRSCCRKRWGALRQKTPHAPCDFVSEDKPYPQLATSGTVDLRIDLTEFVTSQSFAGTAEAGRVSEVEELGTQLEKHTFPDREALKDRRVHVIDAVSAEVREIARRGAWYLVTRIRES